MRIAQVAPLFESVPPGSYGGTERVVSYLTEELVRQGHEVTLFATGDSETEAQLVACCPTRLRSERHWPSLVGSHIMMLEQVSRAAPDFDIIHFHTGFLHFPVCRRQKTASVTTVHGRLDTPHLASLYQEFRELPLVSISNAQRDPLPRLSWQATVYHGLAEDLYSFHGEPGEYLAFLGRISPEKRVGRAIALAELVGMRIKIAAKVDPVDQDYYESVVKPLLREPGVEYVGEIGEAAKDEFLGNAYALIFPIDWPEPFGLVMVEALACGTPVIAYRHGSVSEVIEDGVTGFIVDDLEEAVTAVERVRCISRERCREVFEERFTASRMAQDYLTVYRRLVGEGEDESVCHHGMCTAGESACKTSSE